MTNGARKACTLVLEVIRKLARALSKMKMKNYPGEIKTQAL